MLAEFDYPIMHRLLATAVIFGTCGLVTSPASDLDTIGLTALLSRDSSLTGSGVAVAMAEATVTANATVYQPNPATVSQNATKFTFFDSSSPYPTGNSTFNSSFYSWHANSVGSNFFGSSGVAPGVAWIKVFEADYFLKQIINFGTNATLTLVNQSFITGNQSASTDQLYDNYSDRFKVLFVNGVNNGSATAPPSPATMYNGIAVGLVNGGGSTGPTFPGGLSKPDIAAPSSLTSFATPYVSGSAAILIQAGKRGDGGNATSAVDPRTVKALLLNGAVKPTTWTRNGTEPLDRSLGAGVLNINRSHLQLSGGNHSPTVSSNSTSGGTHLPPAGVSGNVTSLIGWNYKTLTTPSTGSLFNKTYYDIVDHYFFDLPASQSGAFNVVCTLVWHRQNNQSNINNLDLFLYDATANTLAASSTSTVDNVEHIYLTNLPAGRYDLQAFKPSSGRTTTSEIYALAFEFSAVPPPAAPSNLAAVPVSSSQINLTWSDAASDETGFRILRSVSPDSGFAEIGTIAGNATAYSDTPTAAGTLYYYRVSSYSLAGDSSPVTASATTLTVLESWRNDYFQTTTSTGNATDSNDFDSDGVPNLVEYALGTDPTVANSSHAALAVETIGTDSFLSLTIARAGIKPGVTYSFEAGNDLAGWSNNVTVLEDTATTFKARDNVPLASDPKRFIRLKITSP